MYFTLSARSFTTSRILSGSSPGSMTMASRDSSSPMTKQLLCKPPTARVSTIITPPHRPRPVLPAGRDTSPEPALHRGQDQPRLLAPAQQGNKEIEAGTGEHR